MARYEVKVDYPTLGKGTEVEILGLGLVKNGSTIEVDKDQAEFFRAMNQGPVVTEVDKDGNVSYRQEPGPTILEAFKGNEYVTVTTVTEKAKGGDS